MYSFVEPRVPSAPSLVAVSRPMASTLGLDENVVASEEFVQVLSGARLAAGSQPYAMCYGGHQFGNWAGQLGDGRAINLGEISAPSGDTYVLQLKGAGSTPYSRFADGLAVLRSSVREFLCSEAMHFLGVPTTRALSLILTGDRVERDMFYNGNPRFEQGAVVTRVAESFIRFGNFEILAARADERRLEQLMRFTIDTHVRHLSELYQQDKTKAILQWFEEVSERTGTMIVHWMRLGFVHGVMNTDNMSVLGQTIDYGPYGWLDQYDPKWTPNTTDAQHRRYRYENQPAVAQWNLLQLANAIYPLVKDAPALEAIVRGFADSYENKWRAMMAAKLGLVELQESEQTFLATLSSLMVETQIDMTNFYRALCSLDKQAVHKLAKNSEMMDEFLRPLSYLNETETSFNEALIENWCQWFADYSQKLDKDVLEDQQRQSDMKQVNPIFILRNYLAQNAIDAAENGDYSVIDQLMTALQHPYEEHDSHKNFRGLRPEWALNKAGCSMLSCSS